MPTDTPGSAARYLLCFLDYFCALFAILYFSTPQLPNAPVWALAAAIVVFTAAWAAWRLRPRAATALTVAAMSFVLLVAGNTPLIVLPLWLGFIALTRTMGKRAAAVFTVLGFATVTTDHALAGSYPLAALADVAAMAVVAVSRISLARTVGTALKTEEVSRELALSKERERIAADLHDGLGHLLTAIGLSLDFATRVAGREPARAAAELSRARATTTQALETMRTTVRAIAPLDCSHADLDAALAARFDGTGLVVEVVGAAREPLRTQHAPLAVAFAQEALTNVARHARASTARIDVGGTTISVSDDGIGNTAAPSFGLTSLAQRAGAAGSRVDIEPHGGIDGGSRITLVVETEGSR